MHPSDAERIVTTTTQLRNVVAEILPEIDTKQLARLLGALTGTVFVLEDRYQPRPDGVSWITILERTAACVARWDEEGKPDE